jgi:hypothetical protein
MLNLEIRAEAQSVSFPHPIRSSFSRIDPENGDTPTFWRKLGDFDKYL